MDSSLFSLPPFRFDAATDTLWHGARARRLRPRAAALLHYLLQRPGEVVTADEILAALWPGVRVGSGVVKVYVWEIRQALRDRQEKRRFVETVPKRGYRWIAPSSAVPREESADGVPRRVALVGRDQELATLLQYLVRAEQGERQTIVVTGEPGIGKTALIEALVCLAEGRSQLAVASGQCIEHSGPGEAYLPVLTALEQLGRGPRRKQLARVLARHAPTWLVQLPALLDTVDGDVARRAAQGATRERMLRELADALESLTARRPMVLVLEDLQWSDASTLDLIALLARRPGRARLLLLATYRPADVSIGAHPLPVLVRELAVHGKCGELALDFLRPADIGAYLRLRLGAADDAAVAALARAIHQRTEGNPLFMVNVVDELLSGAVASAASPAVLEEATARVRSSVPPSLRQAIESRIERLAPDEQLLLEAASAVGAEFSAAALAAALERGVEEVELCCAALARRALMVEPRGVEEWPDGTAAARYGFVHALYQSVLHDRLTPARRRTLHRLVGERLERGHGARAAEIAATLAVHFEQAHELARAQAYLETAAENALRKHANAEAARHLAHAIELLKQLPDGPGRAEQELGLQVRLGAPLLMTRGYAAPEVIAAYGRALELCRQVGEGPQQLLALAGVYRFSLIRSELRTAHELGEQVLGFARRNELPLAFQTGHLMRGITSFGLGEFSAARDHLALALNLYDVSLRPLLATSFGDDPAVVCLAHTAMTLWFLGAPDQALARCEEALACARETGLPHGLVFALNYTIWCRLMRREGALARENADDMIAIATENDFPYWVAQGTAIRGWVRIDAGELEDGVAEIRRGLDAYEAIGAEVMRPWHLVRLGEAYGRMGRVDDGLAALAESFATMRSKDERFYEAELYRIEGELVLASGDAERAAERFDAALETARRQGSPALELRAALSHARLLRRQRRSGAARALLEGIVARFTEGFATGDLRDAQSLLAEAS